jgi:hypothetical protein
MASQLLYNLLPNQIEVSLYCDAVENNVADLVRCKYVFGVALKFEVFPWLEVLSGETNSEHLRFTSPSVGYDEVLTVNYVVTLQVELLQHPRKMLETSSMLIERAVFQPLLKHRHLAAECLIVESCVHIISCAHTLWGNGKDRFKHHVLYVADFAQKCSQSLDHFVTHSVPRVFSAAPYPTVIPDIARNTLAWPLPNPR